MTILEIRNTIIPNVIMNKEILKPSIHTIGDRAPAFFTSLRAVIILQVHGMKGIGIGDRRGTDRPIAK